MGDSLEKGGRAFSLRAACILATVFKMISEVDGYADTII